MDAVIQTKRAGRNRQLTERDRELCGFLAVCRYLTREQIERLMFSGRSKARSSTRLRQLAKKVGNQRALLRGDLGYGSAEGWTTVWALTGEGFEIGTQYVGLKLERMPKQDVGQAFLKHEVIANEVFLGLVPQDGKTWAKVPRQFRWILGEYLNLPFEDYSHAFPSKLERRRLQPDAILEIPSSRRRFFIEYETGSATVRDAKKSTSTMAKLDRYGNFLCAPIDRLLAEKRETGYTSAFPDRWPPEVLFVTQTEARRDLIAAVIEERKRSGKYEAAARPLTLTEAHRFLCRAVYGEDQPPRVVQTSPTAGSSAPPESAGSVGQRPAESEADERLRRGRVSVRGEQLMKFEKAMRHSLLALNRAQEALARLNVPDHAIPQLQPSTAETFRIVAEYAKRGQEALSRYGLTEAD